MPKPPLLAALMSKTLDGKIPLENGYAKILMELNAGVFLGHVIAKKIFHKTRRREISY